jgi:hypothetical protein
MRWRYRRHYVKVRGTFAAGRGEARCKGVRREAAGRYDRDLKNLDVVVNHKRFLHNILKELGDEITKEQAKFFNSYANLVLI